MAGVKDPALQKNKMKTQIGRIFECLESGEWWTIDEISVVTGDPAASVSAQLRHLRKPEFGSYIIEKQRFGEGEEWDNYYRIAGKEAVVEERPRRRSLPSGIPDVLEKLKNEDVPPPVKKLGDVNCGVCESRHGLRLIPSVGSLCGSCAFKAASLLLG